MIGGAIAIGVTGLGIVKLSVSDSAKTAQIATQTAPTYRKVAKYFTEILTERFGGQRSTDVDWS